jgi:hypothetical protein
MTRTTRRHAITRITQIAEAFDAAAQQWPEDRDHPA